MKKLKRIETVGFVICMSGSLIFNFTRFLNQIPKIIDWISGIMIILGGFCTLLAFTVRKLVDKKRKQKI